MCGSVTLKVFQYLFLTRLLLLILPEGVGTGSGFGNNWI